MASSRERFDHSLIEKILETDPPNTSYSHKEYLNKQINIQKSPWNNDDAGSFGLTTEPRLETEEQ
jgi:hypothetical protein